MPQQKNKNGALKFELIEMVDGDSLNNDITVKQALGLSLKHQQYFTTNLLQ